MVKRLHLKARLGLAALLLAWGGGTTAQDALVDELVVGRSLDQAIRALEGELSRNPFDPVTLNNLAVRQADAGNYSEALALLERAHRLAPTHLMIESNLRDLRDWNQGRLPAEPATRRVTRDFDQRWPDVPPLWPAPQR